MQKSEVNPEKQNPYMDQGLTLKKFFDSAPMMMGVVELEDNDIRHISDNHASAKFFGISVEELEGKFSSELGVPRHAIDLWLKHYHLAEETNSPASFEYELHNNNLLATVSFIGRNPAGVSRFSYILQDVTETREAQNKLKALNRNLELRIDERTKELNIEKNKLACLLNASPIGIAFLDTDLKYDIINPVLARMNGYDQQEHKKMTVYDVIPEDAHNLAPLLKDVIRTGKSILNLEYDSFAKTNRLGTFLANYFPVQLEGKVIGIGATVVDITQRKKSELESKQNELRYRLVVDGIKDHAIIRFDSIGRIIDWNPGAELIFGH
jgi:PAS domain S-box-containing protein